MFFFTLKNIIFTDDLPKQSVVNLLDEYGFDPGDRYPSKFQGRAVHERSKSIMSALELQSQASATMHVQRSGTRERYIYMSCDWRHSCFLKLYTDQSKI